MQPHSHDLPRALDLRELDVGVAHRLGAVPGLDHHLVEEAEPLVALCGLPPMEGHLDRRVFPWIVTTLTNIGNRPELCFQGTRRVCADISISMLNTLFL